MRPDGIATMWQRGRMLAAPTLKVVAVGLAASLMVACTSNSSASRATPTTAASTSTGSSVASTDVGPMIDPLPCDPLDERACLLPWPNDGFTVPDSTTVTGRRLAIQTTSTPANTTGTHIDVTDQNRADGFSPGSTLLTLVRGLDVKATGIAASTDIGASLDADAPILLRDTTTHARVPYWGELDAAAPKGEQLLMIHPAVSLGEGHHFVVALRRMKTSTGATIVRSTGFQAAVDGTPEPPERAAPLTAMLDTLAKAGVATDANLYLAWEFTVASAQSLSGRMLAIRQATYAQLAKAPARFIVTASHDQDGVRTVDGTFDVPNYLTGTGAPGSRFQLSAKGTPTRNVTHPVYTAPFHCLIPLKASAHPTIVYGHGLLGSRGEVDALSFAPAAGIAGACATDEIGMSTDDIGNLAAILGDLSRFPEQADRMQQGMLNQQVLGNLLNRNDGFASAPAFRGANGTPLITVGNTVFVGNSQGGVLGGAISAVSTEWHRVVLGVPGIDYSLLLPRSTDWTEFAAVFAKAYVDPVDRVLALQLIQLLWDRGENDGYAQHLTSHPFTGIPAKQVLLIQAFGDHQVANVSTEVLARTIGARTHTPVLSAGRSPDVAVQWHIAPLDHEAKVTAALVMWDYGTPAPPSVNLPPTEPEYGKDPHGAGSHEPLVLQQALTFLITGSVPDVCNAAACHSDALKG